MRALVIWFSLVAAAACEDDALPSFDADMPDAGDPLACEWDPDPDAGPTPDGGTVTDAATPTDAATATDAASGAVTAPILVYDFESITDGVVADVSGMDPAVPLLIANPASVEPGAGYLAVREPVLIASAGAAPKLAGTVGATNELTVLAWVRPASIDQAGPARIVTYSVDTGSRNFTLGQELSTAVFRLRTVYTSGNGTPALSTPYCALVPRLTHVVYTHDALGIARIYIDGELSASGNVGARITWSDDHRVALANELTEDRPWLGELYHVALWARALSADEVRDSFEEGP